MQFETYQPNTITKNTITAPTVFNGNCLIRKYRVKIEEIEESKEVLTETLLDLWNNRKELGISHSANRIAMLAEAKIIGIELP